MLGMRMYRVAKPDSMVMISAWILVWSSVICNVRSEKATVTCSLSGTNNQNLKMSLRILKENDTISDVSVFTALENDPMSSSPVNDENCRVTGNGEVDTPFSMTVTFDATLLSYPCGIAVININEYRLRVRSFEYYGVKSSSDAFFDAVCDRSAGSQTVVILPQPAFLPVEKNLLRFELFNSQNQPAAAVNLGDKVHFKAEYYYHNDFRVGNCGYDFWVALPQDSDSTSSFRNYLIFSHRQSQPVNVTITDSNGSETLVKFVLNFSSVTLTIEPHIGTERVTDKSIHIISTHQICIHSFNYQSTLSSTIFTVYPTNTLGRDHVINRLLKDNTIVILATENDTDISIEGDTPKLDIPASLTGLNSYESLQVVAKELITKLRIVATKPVAVFMGSKQTTESPDGYAEQITDTTKMGNSFVFYPSYGEIVCTSFTVNTVISYICNDGSLEQRVAQQYQSTTFTASNNHHCMIESSASLTCGQYFKTALSDTVKGHASIIPRSLWSTQYTFGAFVNVKYEILLVIEDGFQNDLKISGTLAGVVNGSTLQWSSILRRSGLTFVGVTFPIGLVFGPIIQVYHPRKPFLTLLRDNRELSVTVPSKSYLDNVWKCSKTLGFSGDLVDSDCDESVDEDIDIFSGSSPYDLKGYPKGTQAAGEIQFTNCIAKSNNVWGDGGTTITFIDQNGCMMGAENDIFTIDSTFSELTSNQDYPKIFSSGYLQSARFSGSTNVYFRCQVLLCYDYSGECFKDACQVGSGYDGDKYDRMYVDVNFTVLYSSEKPLHSRREVTESSSSTSETDTDTFVLICVASFVPLLLSLVVTLMLYKKLVYLIEDTMNKSNDVFIQESNNLNRL